MDSNRPERRTALVAKELARYNIDIAALSETRLAGEGQLTEVGSGYAFFWMGRAEEDRREAGVGFAMKLSILSSLESLPRGVNDRLMVMRLPLQGKMYATIISAYAPTMTNEDEVKEKFYADLEQVLSEVPRSDKLFLLGDFNARVGSDHAAWKGVLGKQGIGKMNSNGLLLLSKCTEHRLVITNTVFRQAHRHKTTWMHPRSNQWHQIDFVIVRQRDLQDVRITRALTGAECWTDHRLLRSKVQVITRKPHRPQKKRMRPKRLDTSKLHSADAKALLLTTLQKNLSDVAQHQHGNSVEEHWASFRDAVYGASLEVIGLEQRRHQDWFDENDDEIMSLLDEKHKAHVSWLQNKSSASKAKYENLRSTLQGKLRAMCDKWWQNKATELQSYADTHDMKNFYCALKAVYGPTKSTTAPVMGSDGKTLLTDRKQILERWAEHFSSVLNQQSSIDQATFDNLPQMQTQNSLAAAPRVDEILSVIKTLSAGKAPGSDGIPAEILKAGGGVLAQHLSNLFNLIWTQEVIPRELRDATIVRIYKRKGSRSQCDNYRGISLLSVPGKVLARILINRFTEHIAEHFLPESQCGFRKYRGTVDMIFSARQLQEKCREQNVGLYSVFVDLTKAFDTVNRRGLWQLLLKLGCPAKFIEIVKQFHEGMQATVIDSGNESEPFPVTNGVKQGCVMAPTLFSVLFAAMLVDAFRDLDVGVYIQYRTDGKLFNLQRLQAKRKVIESLVRDFLFADDCALVAHTQDDLQIIMDRFAASSRRFGLTISLKKTQVMFQPARGQPYTAPDITIEGVKLDAVEQFTYLGSTLSRNVSIDEEISRRISKACVAFGSLKSKLWDKRGIKLATKLQVYQAAVLSSLLYACETWTTYSRHIKQLNRFHLNCLRQILKINWQQHIPDTEILERTDMLGVEAMIMKAQFRWVGHVSRMSDDRLPKQIFYSQLQAGHRSQGGQLKRYKDCLKANFKRSGVPLDNWEAMSKDRSA